MGNRILVVEDDPSLRELLCGNLQQGGFVTLQAGDGEEAFRYFENDESDAIITDYLMPKMNGAELATRIKNATRLFPVIMVTGEAPDDVILRLARFENMVLLMKPFHPNALTQLLRQVLGAPLSDGKHNSRRSTRVPSAIPCVLSTLSAKTRAVISNLSFGGCFIDGKIPEDVGSMVEFGFHGVDRYRVHGRVVWKNERGAGLLFVPVSDEVDEFLQRFVLSKLKQAGAGIMGAGRADSFAARSS